MMLEMITPAADRSLLSVEDLRSAAGITGSASDADLVALGVDVADSICEACGIDSIGVSPGSLREETIRQIERDVWGETKIRLARRPVGYVQSVTVDGAVLADTDYEIDASSGYLYRLQDDVRVDWCARKITVEFTAGWYDVPGGLRTAAKSLVTAKWSEAARDPNLKREKTDFAELEYWVPPTTDPLLSREVQDLLQPYRLLSV